MWMAILIATALAGAVEGGSSDELIVAKPGQLARYWNIDRGAAQRGITTADVPRRSIGCAAVAFVIEPNGSTSSFKLLRDEPEGQWETVSRKVVDNLRFDASDKNPGKQAVYTFITISFNGGDTDTRANATQQRVSVDDKLNEMCAVKDMQFGP